jgi:hypothetical protein
MADLVYYIIINEYTYSYLDEDSSDSFAEFDHDGIIAQLEDITEGEYFFGYYNEQRMYAVPEQHSDSLYVIFPESDNIEESNVKELRKMFTLEYDYLVDDIG